MIRGTKRALEKRPSVKANINASIHNRFDIEVVDAKTGEVKQKAQAENVVCNYLWTRLLWSTTSDEGKWNRYIIYGSGTGTPSAADTKLFNYLGYLQPNTSDDVYSLDSENRVISRQSKGVLTETAAVGSTITEIGISNLSGNYPCTHAMLTDMNGNPVSILKTDADIINIYATVFVHWGEENDAWFAFAQSSENSFFRWLLGANIIYGAMSDVRFTGGHDSTPPSSSRDSFVADPDKKSLSIKYNRLPAASANYGKGGFAFVCSYEWVLKPDDAWYGFPVITGESIGTGDGTTTDFATAFRDVFDAKVYVDGVETAVSVDPAFPFNPYSGTAYAMIPRNPDGTLAVISDYGSAASRGDYAYAITRPGIFENPNFDTFGILEVRIFENSSSNYAISLYASDDFATWKPVAENTRATISVPENLRRSRYFRFEMSNGSRQNYCCLVADVESRYNIHFASPPPAGSVITADYRPRTIAKDENHVFDFSIEFTFGEYNPDA